MNWEAIGAIGQTVSALALIMVIVQVRHARTEAQRSFFEAHHQGIFELCKHRSTSPELNEVLSRARVDLNARPPIFVRRLSEQTGLTTQEALVVYWDQAADFMWRLQFIQNRDTVSQEEREQFEWPLIAAYRNDPVGRLWWESVKPNMSPGNVRYVEQLFARQIYDEHLFSDRALPS